MQENSKSFELPKGKWFGRHLLGIHKKNPQTKTESYSRMMKNRIAKRRAANKVARKSRRINRLIAA